MEPLTECLGVELDIVFLVDSSSSIGSVNFQRVREFVASVIGSMAIGPDNTRVGIVQFETFTTALFTLGESNAKNEIQQAARDMTYLSGTTETSDAILEMINQFQVYGREGATPVGIVVTDGKSNNPQYTAEAVQLARSTLPDLHLIAVAVNSVGDASQPADQAELRLIASGPGDMNILNVDDFQELIDQFETVSLLICNPDSTPPTPSGVECNEVVAFVPDQKDWDADFYGVYELDTSLQQCNDQYQWRHTNDRYFMSLAMLGGDPVWTISASTSCTGNTLAAMYGGPDVSGPLSLLGVNPPDEEWFEVVNGNPVFNGLLSECL